LTVDLNRSGSYLCVMLRALFTILLIAAPIRAWPAQNDDVSALRPAEYMIYQYPNVSLVVKIDAPGIEFESMVYGPENALILSSGVPSGRLGPLVQYIPGVDTPRQLMVKIIPGRTVERSQIGMELIQLPPGDRNSAALAQAYQLFTSGTESTHTNDTTTWAMKSHTLRNAARAFAGLGWEEMRLWSEYYSAHLVLYKLNDELMTMELAGEIQQSARRAGFEKVELAALILEGEALMTAGQKTSGKIAYARFEKAHSVFDQVVLLSDKLGVRTEQARALFNDGLAYEQQDRLDKAVRRFQLALDVSLSTDDSDLVNEIRSTAAAAYEKQGSTSGAIGMLEDIGSDLESDAGQELADNHYEKGRILNSSYRYTEASAELAQAVRIQRSSADFRPWGPSGLALAWSYYSMGDMEQAATLILESIPRTPRGSNTGALIRAYGSLAHIYRVQQQYQQMSQYREKQEGLIKTDRLRAGFLFESAMDARSRDGPGSRQARDLFMQSRQLALTTGQSLAGQRAELYLCLLNIEQNGRGACTAASVRQAHESLRNSGIPGLALDADFVKAKILRREGKDLEALAVMEALIEEILFIRQTLPGLAGAWYWQNKMEVLQEYMAITLAQSGSKANRVVDGRRVLLALDHARLIEGEERGDGEGLTNGGGQYEALRVLLAQRETADGTEAVNMALEANRELRKLREEFTPAIRPLDVASLEKLLAALARDEALLTYYFSSSDSYALVANRKKVSLVKLAGSEQIPDRLDRLRQQFNRETPAVMPDLEAVGRLLLGPVSGLLTQTIYLLPTGPLNGFPFDVLRLDGQFLAEKYSVVNLMNLAAAVKHRQELAQDYRENVFLAGNPQAGQDLFSYDMSVSTEIAALTDIFVGPGLHIVQGVALRKDEFDDTRFIGASLIHLAIQGTLDLAFPDRSRLLMSRASNDSVLEYLSPQDIRAVDFEAGGLKADLVVLSRTAVLADGRSGFDNRLGFVSDFLEAGAGNVIASVWSGGDIETAAFMREFYADLESTGDVAKALSRTRMRRIESGDEANFKSWAGFQLFIR
jgi:CHAT domain-containing protein/tetratricopeptide (TPR) repeat protein